MVRLSAVIILAVGLLLIGPPTAVFACTCSHPGEGTVVFTGVAVDGPSRNGRIWATGGVYAFAVGEEIRGDPHDGRVFTPEPLGGCGHVFELNARYEVHARVAPTGAFPGVMLKTDSCLPIVQLSKAPLPMDFLENGAIGVLFGAVVVKVRRDRTRAPASGTSTAGGV